MKRDALKSLKNWKNSVKRQPLLLNGVRQVGKTWLVREFARTEFDDLIEINFLADETVRHIFAGNVIPAYLISQLEAHFGRKIDPARTLLFLDEIQESQRAMDSLKTFNDAGGDYHIIAAGSFLGVMLGRKPVGQTDQITLYPMSFCEFLDAMGNEILADAIHRRDIDIITGASDLLETFLKQYFYVGGMPAAVLEYTTSKDWQKTREIQNKLLADYRGDFSKHISVHDIAKVAMLWDSIPVHLAKEKKKFIYKEIKHGSRAAGFENAMQWLVDTQLVHKINRVENPQIPLAAYQSPNIFKLYMLDIGLLCAKSDISPRDIIAPTADITKSMNGALAEQFVCQELKAAGVSPLFYWARENSQAEVDFITHGRDGVVPIEVKSGLRTQAKSLNVYIKQYKPKHAVRTSLRNYGIENDLYSVPLYMISEFPHIIQ